MSEHEVAPCALGNPHGQTMPWADATTQLCDGDDGGGVDNDDDQWHECICSEPATTRNQPTDAVSGRTVETATVGMAMRTTATTSSDDAATYSDRSTAGYDWGGGDGATVTDDDVGRGGRGANWRVGQLASLLEEVTMLEAEMDEIRRARDIDRKTVRTLRLVVIALVVFHMAMAFVIALSFQAEWLSR